MLYGRATKSFSGDDETDAVVLVAVAAAAGVGSFCDSSPSRCFSTASAFETFVM